MTSASTRGLAGERRRRSAIVICVTCICAILAVGAPPAWSASAWWHLSSSERPTYLPPEGTGQIAVIATNLGDADAAPGAAGRIVISDTLPVGLKAVSVTAFAGELNTAGGNRGPVECSAPATLITCSFAGTLPPYDQIEVVIGVEVLAGASSGELNQASISGGNASATAASSATTVSEEATPFGLQDYDLAIEEAGGLDTQAGSHPFQVTTTLILNQTLELSSKHQLVVAPVALPKNIAVKLPPGLIGNPTPFPRCTVRAFLTRTPTDEADLCAAQTAVGVASVVLAEPDFGNLQFTVPVFNLEPGYGEPARFGFYIPATQTPVFLNTSVRSGPGEDYGVTVSSLNTSQIAALDSSEVTFWGVPGDPSHDDSRGWGCLNVTREKPSVGLACESPAETHPPALLMLPTSCPGSPLQSSVELDSWTEPANVITAPTTRPLQALDGCNRLAFAPTVQAEPTTDSAASPSGLGFHLNFNDEGLTSAENLVQSQLNKTVVTLPEGFTIDPSAGVGLAGCTSADYARETLAAAPGTGCPNESKLGTVEIETPLLTQKIDGSIFIAQPYENPFNSLVAVYVVAKNPGTGVIIKLAGRVEAGGQPGVEGLAPGQLRTVFENSPQLPFDHFTFHFREGAQAPLITPVTCGDFSIDAALTPWSEPAAVLRDTSAFAITSGVGGGACPSGGVPPFAPQIAAGTLNNNAGVASPFYIRLTRGDGEQEISGFSTDLPPGLTGDLTGIPYCPEAAIALARAKSGAEETANPSCPAASEIGHTLVGTGAGAVLAYVPGKLYLAGPYDGDPFSLVSVTSAVVGPFDLGTVVLRFGLKINPYTAQVSVDPTASEPIPTIIKGIVTHVRDIRVYVERKNFILNPTSCSPMAISSTLTGDLGASTTVSSPFQAASCTNLKFAPTFTVSTNGKTSKEDGASLTAKLSYPNAAQGTYADIAKVKVELPKALPSRLTTLQKACTAAQFSANPAGCPAGATIGHATVHTPILPVPLTGPVIFVSHGGEAFPSLTIVLQGDGVTIDIVGATFISKSGVTSTTFKTVPDEPFSTFELTLPEGPDSALAANENLCAPTIGKTVIKKVTVERHGQKKSLTRKIKEQVPTSLVMPDEFVAQNGAEIHGDTTIKVEGCPKAKKATARKEKRAKKGK